MSHPVQGAVAAQMSLDSSIASLEHRLLGLRAEIDAILAHIAACKSAPQADAELAAVNAVPGQAEPEVVSALSPEAAEVAPASAALEPAAEGEGAPAASAGLAPQPLIGGDAEVCDDEGQDTRIGSDLAGTLAERSEQEAVAPPEVATEAAAATTDLEATDTVAPIPAAPASLEAPESAPEVEQPSLAPAATNEPSPTAPAASPSNAQIVAFEPRLRKQKDILAQPIRSGRKRATRTAACIFALLVAGTALVAADRDAIGSVQVPPWMSQLPSFVPSAAAWSIFGQKQDAADEERTTDTGRSADDVLLQRYREAWPSGA